MPCVFSRFVSNHLVFVLLLLIVVVGGVVIDGAMPLHILILLVVKEGPTSGEISFNPLCRLRLCFYLSHVSLPPSHPRPHPFLARVMSSTPLLFLSSSCAFFQ